MVVEIALQCIDRACTRIWLTAGVSGITKLGKITHNEGCLSKNAILALLRASVVASKQMKPSSSPSARGASYTEQIHLTSSNTPREKCWYKCFSWLETCDSALYAFGRTSRNVPPQRHLSLRFCGLPATLGRRRPGRFKLFANSDLQASLFQRTGYPDCTES